MLRITAVILIGFAVLEFCDAVHNFRMLRDPASYHEVRQKLLFEGQVQAEPPKPTFTYSWSEEYYEGMPIDHFSFTDTRTFKLRYLINTTYFVTNGPIFFYTGNEGGIEGFAENTGFMWDIAPEYKAAVVFAEHRFYGKTKPFGNDSYANVKNLGYLSSEQALADFAQLIYYLKNEHMPGAGNSPVIAFGGSYGGMLTAWMRIKYPHIIDGGIAASAPVFWFQNADVRDDIFDEIVTRTFRLSGCNLKSILASFEAIVHLAQSDEGRQYLNHAFHLAPVSQLHVPDDGRLLVLAIQGVMETMAMVDYPYPANFLSPLPAWPVKEVCKSFSDGPKQTEEDNAAASFSVLNVFYNTTGQTQTFCVLGDNCPTPFSALGDPLGWPWQTCTEMVMPMCSYGPPLDVFAKTCPFKMKSLRSYCNDTFGSANFGYDLELFRPNWAIINYGASFPTATNIVFSNGYLDPWSGGGWNLKPITKGTLVSLIVEDGAHHLDLRAAHPNDTESVKEVRRIEKLHINRWIEEHHERRRQAKKELKQRLRFTDL
ncbi:serine carboxypeptidase s28 domain-containing protein [Ditylenchus destructor]|nr:serine carboxypeptidase s28 domain-containing protein [Ditylenchus destructor]